MSLAVGIFACLFLFAAVITWLSIRNAPEGFEDDGGFHSKQGSAQPTKDANLREEDSATKKAN